MVQPCNILSLVSALQLHMPRLCSTAAFVAKAAPASLRVANVLRHMATLCDLPMCPKEHARGITKVLVAWPWDFSANGCQWNDVAHAWARSDSTMVCVCVQCRCDRLAGALPKPNWLLHPEKSYSTDLAPILGEAWQVVSFTTLFVECAVLPAHFNQEEALQ